MVIFQQFVKLAETIMTETANISSWLSTPIFEEFTPLLLLSITGLIAYLSVAIVKWVIQ